MSALFSMPSTSGFVCRSCWICGLDRMSCLISRGLEVERMSCTKELRRTQCIISGSPRSCFSISLWSTGKKPGLLFSNSRFSKPSTETRCIQRNRECKWMREQQGEEAGVKISSFSLSSYPDRVERWESGLSFHQCLEQWGAPIWPFLKLDHPVHQIQAEICETWLQILLLY